MTRIGCAREAEVLVLLRSGRWTAGCPAVGDEELRAHVASCQGCRDLVEVAAALLQEREALLEEAPIPGSGLVWWRLQLRRRQEAARAARRALVLVQVVCVSVAGAVSLAMLQTLVPGWTRHLAVLRPDLPAMAGVLLLLGLIAWLAIRTTAPRLLSPSSSHSSSSSPSSPSSSSPPSSPSSPSSSSSSSSS